MGSRGSTALTLSGALFLSPMLTTDVRRRFEERGSVDFSFSYNESAASALRIRANVFKGLNGTCAALRLLPGIVPTLQELHLPAELAMIVNQSYGLVLVVGPTGSGKSTTLAAMVELILLRQLNRRHLKL